MTYIERFGNLRKAYELIGYHPESVKVHESKRAAHHSVPALGDWLPSMASETTD
jgi:hypothetical protein